jgi:hypothetical protein
MSTMLPPGGPPPTINVPRQGGAPGVGAGIPGKPDNPDAASALKSAVDALHAAFAAEEDDQDRAAIAKALTAVQSIMGGRQKQDEAALGTTPAHKAMARATRSQGGAAGGSY